MRIVGRPHHVIDPHPMAVLDADRVVDEGRMDLPVEILAGPEGERSRVQVPELLEALVPPLEDEGQPTHVVLRRYDLQAGEPFQHPREDEESQGALHLVAQGRRPKIAVDGFQVPAHPAHSLALGTHAGDRVQAEGPPQFLGLGPEGIVGGIAVGTVFGGRGWLGADRVAAHHGSLSKERRQRLEDRLRAWAAHRARRGYRRGDGRYARPRGGRPPAAEPPGAGGDGYEPSCWPRRGG